MFGKYAGTSLVLALVLTLLVACGPTPAPEAPAAPTQVQAQQATQAPEPTAVPTEPTAVPTEPPAPGADKQGGTLVMGFYQEPELLNEYIRTQTVADIIGAFFERGLVQVQADGSYGPDLAKEVPTLENGGVSEDGLTLTYNLKDNIVWSDGDPFDCEDVKFTYDVIVHPESGAVSTSGYVEIESLECVDPHTLVIKMQSFYAPFITLFDTAILPSHIGLEPAKMQEWEYNRTSNPSLGPFVMQEWSSGDHMTIVRNEKFELWEPEGKPYLDAIVLRWIESREVGKQLIQTGELDFVWDMTEADIPEAQSWGGVKISMPPSTGTERLLLNLRDPTIDAPCVDFLRDTPSWHWALGDARVREAIELGIDKQLLVDKLLYGFAPVGTTEMNIGPYAPTIEPTPFDPEKAKALLEEAGWTDTNGDGIRECHGCAYAEEGKVLRLKIQTTSGNALREQTQQVLLEMMAEIGIEMYIENVPSAELFGSYASGAFRKHGQFDIVMFTTTYSIDPHSHMHGYYGSDNIPCDDNGGTGFNYSRWIDDEADAAFQIAGSSPDPEVRKEAYQTASERIAQERPQIYLYDRADIDLLREKFMGYNMNIWAEVAWNSEEWYIEE